MGLEDGAFSALRLIQDQIHFWNPFVRISIILFIYNHLRYCFIAFSWHLQGVRLQYWYLIIWIVLVLRLLCKCRVVVARGRSSTTFPTNIDNWLFMMIMIFYPFLFTIFIILHYFLYDAFNMMLKLVCSFVWFIFKNHHLIVDAYFVTYFPIAVLLWNASGIYTLLAVYY